MREQEQGQSVFARCSGNVERTERPDRRSFLWMASLVGAGGALSLGALLDGSSAKAKERPQVAEDNDEGGQDRDDFDVKKRDTDILIAAEIAEALAVTTY